MSKLFHFQTGEDFCFIKILLFVHFCILRFHPRHLLVSLRAEQAEIDVT